jgi:excisionase family DNA binding protein
LKNGENQQEQPLALRVEEAARLTRLSRATAFRLVSAGEWPSFKCGRRRLVPADGLRAWEAAQTAAATAAGPLTPTDCR